jgi:nucleoside-diphosphate-sugar epimerase
MAVLAIGAAHPRVGFSLTSLEWSASRMRTGSRDGRRAWGLVWRGSGEGEELGDGVASTGNRAFIFGMGYTSVALANNLRKRGWEVAGTCRSEEKRGALEARGFRAHRFNPNNDGEGLRAEAIRELHEATHIVSSIPPVGDFDCDPVLASLREELLSARLQWVGYLSSTSVYGDWQGGWVEEDSEPRPLESKAVARWEAEKSWLRFGDEAGVCVHVFRLGGIYGPGRSALDTARVRKLSTRQQLRGQKRFTSRVHVADICQVIVKAMASGQQQHRTGRVYNVVDDDPSPRAEVMAYARALLHGEGEKFSPASEQELSEAAAGNASHVSEKRVSNRRVKEELHVEFLHPTFRSGLEAIANGSNDPFD